MTIDRYMVKLPVALLVLNATGNPVTDNDVLGVCYDSEGYADYTGREDRLYRLIRHRIERLGLCTGYQFSDGLEAMVEGAIGRNPVQSAEVPPRPVKPPQTGWPKAGECAPLRNWVRDPSEEFGCNYGDARPRC